MSYDLHVFTPTLGEDLILPMMRKLAAMGMDCLCHPDFAFDADKDDGFVPILLMVRADNAPVTLTSKVVASGFEMLIDEYDYAAELELLKEDDEGLEFVADPDIDPVLKKCKFAVHIIIHNYPPSEFRVGMYFAAVLADLSGGVVLDPQFGDYFEGGTALDEFPQRVVEYEESTTPEEWAQIEQAASVPDNFGWKRSGNSEWQLVLSTVRQKARKKKKPWWQFW